MSKHKLIGLKRAIKYINIPDGMNEALKAVKRIKFEELFKYQLKIKYMFYMRKNNPEGVAVNFDVNKVNEFINDNLKLKKEIIVIVHGRGTGVLKNAVHETLKNNKNVLEYKTYYNNLGCTIVKLKKC